MSKVWLSHFVERLGPKLELQTSQSVPGEHGRRLLREWDLMIIIFDAFGFDIIIFEISTFFLFTNCVTRIMSFYLNLNHS